MGTLANPGSPIMPQQDERSRLERRVRLAQALEGAQRPTTPVAAGIDGLARIIASVRGGKAEDQLARLNQSQQTADMEAIRGLGGSDNPLAQIAQISDPRLQQLATLFASQDRASERDFLKIQLDEARRREDIGREDRMRSEDLAREDASANREDARFQQTQAAARQRHEESIALERRKQEITAAKERATPAFIEQQSIQASRKRLEELQSGEAGINQSLETAEAFLKAFETGEASGPLKGLDLGDGAESGGGRAALGYAPTFTDQGRFDELFNSFAETAARAKLKASGELRPTDADVEGMKRAMFGVGRDEKTNISLLRGFIEEQRANQQELAELRRAFGGGGSVPSEDYSQMSDDELMKELGL